ncbi:hypothetical protein [Spirosoma foliorum]|uniref:Uncharacterized protein n=1 Tax=Spirosoma foliorum TaxID=2710596 RepID=A0A7G5H2E8_9BACT|nr:hypothetical protein [Spirosoma foliorum]QMW05290.1 hypothetical protein H3H32_10595 [Spirosoma foliorum]
MSPSPENVKPFVWYTSDKKPPKRTQKYGGLPLVLLINEHIQEGFYSHYEGKFYAYAERYTPVDLVDELLLSIDQINKSLTWQQVEVNNPQWMLVANPAE